MLVWRQRLCKKVGKRTSSVNNWKEWKVVQAKKTGNRKKDVFVSILFLYLEKYLYKILIYSMLLYIKITFSRFQTQDKAETLSNKKYVCLCRLFCTGLTKIKSFFYTTNRELALLTITLTESSIMNEPLIQLKASL